MAKKKGKPSNYCKCLFVLPIFIGGAAWAIYWACRGVSTGTTLWASRSGPLYVARAVEPAQFWYSVFVLFACGSVLLYLSVRVLRELYAETKSDLISYARERSSFESEKEWRESARDIDS